MPTRQVKLDTSSRKLVYERGRRARKANKPIFANPFIGIPARIWSAGYRGDPIPNTVRATSEQILVNQEILQRMTYSQLEMMGLSRTEILILRTTGNHSKNV
jgi:hypothetical protein